jgi:hypothetical protein
VKRPALALLGLGMVLTLALSQRVEGEPVAPEQEAARTVAAGEQPADGVLPREHIFDGRVLVAYYGTAGTGALGVLGESSPARAIARVQRAAAPFVRDGLPAQPVFELIVTIADAHPGKDGDYNHDISPDAVRPWIDAAREAGALLVLDLQTGTADFPSVAKRWEWALREPHVGLAIDPEWRMRRGQVPGRVIGSVTAWEVNLTSRWLEELTVANGLPEKLFMLHQFRTSMVRNIGNVRGRAHLASVQHVDGFGTPREKYATYRAVARPDLFHMGFKLFYDEDVRRLSAEKVMRVNPRVDFVSFQ